jgi:putative ABC transport system permease protein
MYWVALKMLMGNRAKCYAIVFGIAFASMLMTQQASSLTGLLRTTTSTIRDVLDADIWVMDPSVQFIDDITPLSENDLYRVRGVPGVAWAVRLYCGKALGEFPEGKLKRLMVLGLDDQTLVGAPQEMLAGSLSDLRKPDAVVLDETGYRYLFPGQEMKPGRIFEMNERRAVIVGVCKASPTFQTLPIVYTRYSLALTYTPQERRTLSFILTKADPNVDPDNLARRIEEQTGLMALSQRGFTRKTISYYLRRTAIPVNYGITVLLGFLIGAAIAGQMFYLFTLDNLAQFGCLKAMGVRNRTLVRMVLFQALVVGTLGYCIGFGLAAGIEEFLAERLSQGGLALSHYMAWPIPLGSSSAAAAIVTVSALVSLRRVLTLEPVLVFR